MKTNRYVLYAGILVAVLAAALIAGFGLRDRNPQVATSPTPATSTPVPATTAPASASAAPTALPSPAPTAQTGATITGRISYPSDFIPPVTVYAWEPNQRIWSSVEFPGFGNPPRPTAQPGTEPGTYTLTGVAPGTYVVVAYRNDGQKPDPGLHTREAECLRRTPRGPCPDQTTVLVTVSAGQTAREIDIVSWYPGSGLMPPPPPRPVVHLPTPEGFVLPQSCAYVADPTRSGTTTEWRFNCGGAPDSAQRVAAALDQQGWARCLPQPGGIGEWWKGPTTTRVTEGRNASDPPTLSQYPRSITNCP